ncbi:MAG: DUF2799 domain-containing protein [Pseudomonadota bacterium]
MKPEITVGIGIPILLLLASCQTLSKEECIAADWRVIGEQDGAAGYAPQQRFGDHAKSCEKAGVVPNQSLWNEGYQLGLRRFCTPLSGLAHGQKGGQYQNVCPTELAGGFVSGYSLGLEQHNRTNELNSIKRRISTAERTVANNQDLIREGKIDQAEGEANIRTNQRLINDLNRELGRKEAEKYRIDGQVEDFRLDQQFGNTGQTIYN